MGLLRSQTTYALRCALRSLPQEWKTARAHVAAVREARKLNGSTGLKLNYGCGKNQKPGWINIDGGYGALPGVMTLDAREPMPFKSGSAELVYSEHFVEHLSLPLEVGTFMRESLRVLKRGGRFSAGVPDFEAFVRAYVSNDAQFWKEFHAFGQPAECQLTPMAGLNFIVRNYEHRYAYDEATLGLTLRNAGFVNVKRREFDPGLDDEKRKWNTLYMDAYKP